jgi:hypothetical protein
LNARSPVTWYTVPQAFDRLPGALAAAGGSAYGGGAGRFFSALYGACAEPDAVLQNLLEQGGRLSAAVHRCVLEGCS